MYDAACCHTVVVRDDEEINLRRRAAAPAGGRADPGRTTAVPNPLLLLLVLGRAGFRLFFV